MRSLQKVIALLLTGILLISACATTAAEDETCFTDVPSDSWYAESVIWAIEQGITTGTSATTFSPEATCSNAEVVTFLWRACGSPDPASENPYDDISGGTFYYKAALWAYQSNMVSEEFFQPDKPCTRSMAVNYMWNVAGNPQMSNVSEFTDVQPNDIYAQAVTWALENDITTGTSNSTFSPDKICTRAEIVTFLYRDLGINAGIEGNSDKESVIFEDTGSGEGLELEENPEILEETTIEEDVVDDTELKENPQIVEEPEYSADQTELDLIIEGQ